MSRPADGSASGPVGPRRARHLKERDRRWPFSLASATYVVLPVLVIVFVISRLISGSEAASCTGAATPLVIAGSLDKSAVLAEFADDFSRQGSDPAGRCVKVTVAGKASGAAQTALAAGWQEADGPRPDVWSPSSSVWLSLLEDRLARSQRSSLVANPAAAQSVASSPEVVAMPRPMAQALGWPGNPIGWRDLLTLSQEKTGWAKYGHPEWGRFVLGKTNPNVSQVGLDATIASYYAGSGVGGRVKASGLTLDDVRSARTRAFVAGVEQSVLRYGDTSVSLLADWQRADQQGQALTYLSAVLAQESLVQSYNEGNPTADPAEAGKLPRPKVPLVAVYPAEGTFYVDHPFVTLSAPWVDADKRAAAQAFLSYLRSPQVQARWAANNFRTYDHRAGPKAVEAVGVLPDRPTTILSHPEPKVVAAVLSSWGGLRKSANVLSLIDVSGSMKDTLPGSGTSKLAAAQAAAAQSLELFTDRDEVGLWSFAGGGGSGPDHRELVPIGPMSEGLAGGSRRQALGRALGSLRAGGNTGLYNTIGAAYQRVLSRGSDGRINAVVVLTDGRNDAQGGLDLDALLKVVTKDSGGRTARIITIAYGPDADRATLVKIATATGGASYAAPTPADLPKVYASALSNF
jgi:Ca-activated chloride channel homolog